MQHHRFKDVSVLLKRNEMNLHVPSLLDIADEYHHLLPILKTALEHENADMSQWLEIMSDDCVPQSLTEDVKTLGCILNHPSFPDMDGLLCLNQVLHRMPNPHDFLRPLLARCDELLCIVELKMSMKNPYPARTAGVFSYGSDEKMLVEAIELCYCRIVWRYHTPTLFCLLVSYP